MRNVVIYKAVSSVCAILRHYFTLLQPDKDVCAGQSEPDYSLIKLGCTLNTRLRWGCTCNILLSLTRYGPNR